MNEEGWEPGSLCVGFPITALAQESVEKTRMIVKGEKGKGPSLWATEQMTTLVQQVIQQAR